MNISCYNSEQDVLLYGADHPVDHWEVRDCLQERKFRPAAQQNVPSATVKYDFHTAQRNKLCSASRSGLELSGVEGPQMTIISLHAKFLRLRGWASSSGVSTALENSITRRESQG